MSGLEQVWIQEDLLETALYHLLVYTTGRSWSTWTGGFQQKLSWTRCSRTARAAPHQLMGKSTWDCTTATQNTAPERSILWIADPLGQLFCSPVPFLRAPGLAKAAMAISNPGEPQVHSSGMAQVLRNRHGQESSTAPGTTRRMQESILKYARELLQLFQKSSLNVWLTCQWWKFH